MSLVCMSKNNGKPTSRYEEHATGCQNEASSVDFNVHSAFNDVEDLAKHQYLNGPTVSEVPTKVLSLVLFVGFEPPFGMMSWPAAMKLPSPNIFWKKNSALAAAFGSSIFGVKATPKKRNGF